MTALHPGVTREQCTAATGWDLRFAPDVRATLPQWVDAYLDPNVTLPRAGHVALYDAIAGDTSAERSLRDLASYLAAQSLLDTADEATLERRGIMAGQTILF